MYECDIKCTFGKKDTRQTGRDSVVVTVVIL